MTTTATATYPTIAHDFEEEIQNTRKLLERVPLDDAHRNYKPHEKSMTLEALASHVADAPRWVALPVESDEFEWNPSMKPRIAKSTAELLQMFDEGAEHSRIALLRTSDTPLRKDWSFKYPGGAFTNSRTHWVRSFLNHLIHHRAQLGVYLRLNNIAIPGMYGPSADEQ
jgi:uncharacterized damage-inducible protein DinB